jgi:hypothetical protein
MMERFENVLTKDDGERIITRLPDEFINDVLDADDSRINQAVNDWAESDELSCEPQEVRTFVDDLKRLAEVARSSGRSLYLWNCV